MYECLVYVGTSRNETESRREPPPTALQLIWISDAVPVRMDEGQIRALVPDGHAQVTAYSYAAGYVILFLHFEHAGTDALSARQYPF